VRRPNRRGRKKTQIGRAGHKNPEKKNRILEYKGKRNGSKRHASASGEEKSTNRTTQRMGGELPGLRKEIVDCRRLE